ncbi:MAG: SLC13 family permease [Caulobacteraceae bacterium]|nr:SLC13 family permease [Caulobacteraceae bacterium]
MSLPQAFAFSIVAGAIGFFVWGRFRYDVVALIALLAGVACGVVPAAKAFSGFTSDVVVIIASALVISAAIARSGVVEQALQPLLARLKTPAGLTPVLAAATAALSMLTKNVGALAILMPVAVRAARGAGASPASLLMPMSFMALLGGLVTLVGTSTNIIVSQVREQALGKPFQMFDFAPVGLALTALGFLYVSFAWRLLPRDRQPGAALGDALAAAYVAEAALPDGWPAALARVGDLKLEADGVRITALARGRRTVQAPGPRQRLRAGDILVIEGPQEALNAVFSRTPLIHTRAGKAAPTEDGREETRQIEAVIQPKSALAGRSAARMQLSAQFGVNLLAVSRSGARISQQLRTLTLRAGDVLILEAGERTLPAALVGLGLLPLVERDVQVVGASRRYLPVTILALAMALVVMKVTPVAVGFFGAAALMAASGALSMREAYNALDAQVLVLVGALTPLSQAVQDTGGAALIAQALAALAHGLPALLTLGALMVAAMAAAPFLHNAPTVLVLGPIGVALARQLHLNPDAFLMAVATGAGCDFLTPVGHQCNTLIMGPGGYRFGDYARFGAPLAALVILAGVPLIALVWPLG